MTEEWRTAVYDNEIYEGLYKVSNLGRILSLNYNGTGKPGLMKPFDNGNGYLRVNLRKNGEYKTCSVHRLIAFTFLENPENKPFVNHKIEGDKGKKINIVYINENGSIDEEKSTIEWCTAKENNDYGTHNERVAKANSKHIIQLTLDGEFVREWESAKEAGRNGFDSSHVTKCCRGKLKTHKGFRFMYYDDYKEKQFKEFGCLPLW